MRLPRRLDVALDGAWGLGAGARAGGLALAVLLGLGLSACSPRAPQGLAAVSEQGQRLCRERLADQSPNTTAIESRQAYIACLRTIERERQALPPAAAPVPAPAPPASAEERYLFCRFHSEAIAAVYDAYTRASGRWAAADSAYANDDPRYLEARQDHAEAVAAAERLIPPAMRGGLPLLPDALTQLRRCDRQSFR